MEISGRRAAIPAGAQEILAGRSVPTLDSLRTVLTGDVLADRFELGRLAGSGGMGDVYQGVDRRSGAQVAVKVLIEGRGGGETRFEREAQLLAELHHPGLVRYVADGTTPQGKPYLVMEWLEGEDLSRRLARARLSIAETMVLGTRVAEALAVVHAHGVVHRDLKPSNLFLVGGLVREVKVLDFGIARLGGVTGTTQTGVMMGTLGYMAPEQARSGQALDPRADVFALGCVLFECLTGVPAFAGTHLMALLAKILFEEAPRVSDLRPEVPEALDQLVARMLCKEPDERLRDGAAVAAAMIDLGTQPGLRAPVTGELVRLTPVHPALTGGERRMLSLVMIASGDPIDVGSAQTLPPHDPSLLEEEMREASEARGGRLEVLVDGSVLVTITGATRIATDQAAQGARCALALRAFSGNRPMALATGRAEVLGQIPVGEVIDRAARMIIKRQGLADDAVAPIALDEVTAGLLDARFEVRGGRGGLELHAERELVEGAKTLLGTPTICVGRDRELRVLDELFNECVEGPSAQAALVTSPAGLGKSRIAHELIRLVRKSNPEVEIWIGRGDSLRAGSAFGMIGQAIRGACGILEGEALPTRQQKLRARVVRNVPLGEQRRVTEFLGELVGAPFPDEDSAPLRAARQEALIMGDQMRRAWEDFLRAETGAQPVLLVLEDLHWGDLPTVRFVDTALRTQRDRPWMVLALARPEVHDLFPRLWVERGLSEIHLKELTAKASEKLIRQVLGERVSAETVARLVSYADGHAFYLEELIRAVAEGRGGTLPESVLAMVEARLGGLELDARRVLRAASVFGEVFWHGGVMTLLGGRARATKAQDWLNVLVEREFLLRRPESRFSGEQEYSFRHALLREGAYAMLTEADRVLGHRLAGEWLEKVGESDSIALAEHFERGKDPARAGVFYLHAAERAQRGSDTEGAMTLARRGLASDPPDPIRVPLLAVLCESHAWRKEWGAAEPYAEAVMRLAPPGSAAWAAAAPAKLVIALGFGNFDEFLETLNAIQAVAPEPGAASALASSLATGIVILEQGGHVDLSESTLERLDAIVDPIADRDPLARAWRDLALAYLGAFRGADPYHGLLHAEAARASFFEAGDHRGVILAQVLSGRSRLLLGDYARAERELRESREVDDGELGVMAVVRSLSWIELLSEQGRFLEAHAEAARLIAAGGVRKLPQDEGRGHWLLADVLRRQGDLEAAEHEVRLALRLVAVAPMDHMAATALLAAIRLAQGRVDKALDAAEETIGSYQGMRAYGFRGPFARLIYAEILDARGQRPRALQVLASARDYLLAQANKIGDPVLQQSFLEAVPDHARTFALLAAWSSERPPSS
jgi:tetratricopeptide (TPR) repeat protein